MSESALVIEDTAANRDFFERLLVQAGFEVVSATTGKEAMEKSAEIEDLALAIIDMQIPDISGLELTLRLRKRYENACLIVATMHDERSLMESAFQKGCDVFLVKPHGFMELFKRLTTIGSSGLHGQKPLVIDQHGPRTFRMSY